MRSVFADCLGATLSPGAEVARIRRFLEPIFERRYSSAVPRIQDVDQLERVAGGYTSRGAFLAELAPIRRHPRATWPGRRSDSHCLGLSTVHSAKGGEWAVVHVIHAADGMIPSDMSTSDAESIEEERRLFYVALTRARDMLYVYFPLRFYRRPRGQDDAHHYAQLTRFLPSSVQALFDHDAAPHTLVPEPRPRAPRTVARRSIRCWRHRDREPPAQEGAEVRRDSMGPLAVAARQSCQRSQRARCEPSAAVDWHGHTAKLHRTVRAGAQMDSSILMASTYGHCAAMARSSAGRISTG